MADPSFLQDQWLWTVVLGLALFFPVRQLIWVLSVRRLERQRGQPTTDAERHALRRRATVTAALVCFVFSVAYVQVMLGSASGQP